MKISDESGNVIAKEIAKEACKGFALRAFIVVIAGTLLGMTVGVLAGPTNLRNEQKLLERHIQMEKQPELFVLSNQYILLCDYISNTNTQEVLDIATLTQHLIDISITDPNKEVVLFQYLSALQIGLQRAGGLLWWDTCKWHDEDWAVYYATQNHNALFNVIGVKTIQKEILSPTGKPLGIRLTGNLKK